MPLFVLVPLAFGLRIAGTSCKKPEHRAKTSRTLLESQQIDAFACMARVLTGLGILRESQTFVIDNEPLYADYPFH